MAPTERPYSPEAMSLAILDVVYRLLDHLRDRQLLTEEEATEFFARGAQEQALVDSPANKEAAELLAWIAKERARKFR